MYVVVISRLHSRFATCSSLSGFVFTFADGTTVDDDDVCLDLVLVGDEGRALKMCDASNPRG